MAMTYQAKFNYRVMEGEELATEKFGISVQIFQVTGGAQRSIKLSSTDDISISSELEQARAFKNVVLFLPPTKDGSDMEVALNLTNYFELKKTLLMSLVVERYSSGKMIEGLALLDGEATLLASPSVTEKRLLKLNINLPAAKLFRGTIKGRSMADPTEM